MDSDDEWDTDHIRKLVTELMYRGPGYGMSYCDIEIHSEKHGIKWRPLEGTDRRNLSGDVFSFMLTHVFISIHVLIRREILEKTGGFNENLLANEDWELFLRISRISLVAEVPEVLVTVTDSENSLGKNDRANAEAFLYVCELYDLEHTEPEAFLELQECVKEKLYNDDKK